MTTELPPQASYVKAIDVPQLPAEPATEFKKIEGYSRETETERTTEKPEDTSLVEAPEVAEVAPPDDAEVLAEDAGLTDG